MSKMKVNQNSTRQRQTVKEKQEVKLTATEKNQTNQDNPENMRTKPKNYTGSPS